MRYFILTCLLFAFSSVYSQSKKTSEDFYVTEEGEKVMMYGDIEMSAQYLLYDNEKGRQQQFPQKKVKVMVAKNRLFVNMPITKNMERLHEVIAFSDKYILTLYFGESVYYVFDRNENMIEGRINFYGNKKKCMETFNAKIAKYFTECKELLEEMRKNINADKIISETVTYYQCGEKDYFGK